MSRFENEEGKLAESKRTVRPPRPKRILARSGEKKRSPILDLFSSKLRMKEATLPTN